MRSEVQKLAFDSPPQSSDDASIKLLQVAQAGKGRHIIPERFPKTTRFGFRICRLVFSLTTFIIIFSIPVYLYRHFQDDAVARDAQSGGSGIRSSTRYFGDVEVIVFHFIRVWSVAISLFSTGSVTIAFFYFVGYFDAPHNGGGKEIPQVNMPPFCRRSLSHMMINFSPDGPPDTFGRQKYNPATKSLISKVARLIGVMIVLRCAFYSALIKTEANHRRSLLIQAAQLFLSVSRATNQSTSAQPHTSVHSFGRGISMATREWLADPHNADQGTGSLVPRYNNEITNRTLQVWLRNSSTAYQTLERRSPDHAIATFRSENHTVAYLTEKTIPSNLNYNATTVGASTSCRPVVVRCYPCPAFPFNFSGVLPRAPRILRLFNDSAPTFNNKSSYTSPTNPFSWGFFANVDGWDYPDDLWTNNPFIDDMNVIISSATLPSLTVMMSCNTTVYDITYSVVNSTIDHFQTSIGNDTLSGLIGSPMFPVSALRPESDSAIVPPSQMDPWPGFDSEILALGLRAASAGNDSYAIADSWSTVFSRAAVASAAGVMEKRINTGESSRQTVWRSEWPTTMVNILVGLDLLFVLSSMGVLVLAAMTWRSTW